MGLFSKTRTPRASSGRAPHPTLALLYMEHFDNVVSSVRFFGVPERDAPDVAQDVWMRVDASLDRYDPTRAFGPWLKTIAYRTARNHLRSAHSRRIGLAPTENENEMEVMDTAAGPERRTLFAEMQQVFAEALQELNEDHRTVYLMSVMDEIPIPEIAEALGELENTVRSRLSRAHHAMDTAIARRRTVEERRQSALAPMLVPALLTDTARKGFNVDPGVKAVVWSQLTRLLGLGIIGALAPASGAAIVAGAALLVAVGAGAGALLHAALEKPAPTETIAHVEMDGHRPGTAAPGGPPSASSMASAASATATATPTVSPSSSVAEADAGAAQDPGATLRAETAILAKAREAMATEHYEVALRELQRHARLFPNGRLVDQRKDMQRVVQAELSQRDGGSQ